MLSRAAVKYQQSCDFFSRIYRAQRKIQERFDGNARPEKRNHRTRVTPLRKAIGEKKFRLKRGPGNEFINVVGTIIMMLFVNYHNLKSSKLLKTSNQEWQRKDPS